MATYNVLNVELLANPAKSTYHFCSNSATPISTPICVFPILKSKRKTQITVTAFLFAFNERIIFLINNMLDLTVSCMSPFKL